LLMNRWLVPRTFPESPTRCAEVTVAVAYS
jgi:hypothetical protein